MLQGVFLLYSFTLNVIIQSVRRYDNENSYTSQMVRTIKYFAELA